MTRMSQPHGREERDGSRAASNAADDALETTFVELYRTQFTEMVRLAAILLGSDASAEDLVHDAFLRVHARWRTVEHPRAYLRRVVVNACRTSRQRLWRERRASQSTLVPVADLEANELFDALAKLPYRQRAAIVLRYYEGLTYAEIADALQCPEGTAASLINRGTAQLRRTVGQ